MNRQCFMQFELDSVYEGDLKGGDGNPAKARRGRLKFPRGTVETPAFMPVGTYGTVKGMLPRDIKEIGAEIILGNTFHLMLRPGTEVIRAHSSEPGKEGTLHDFMQCRNPANCSQLVRGCQIFSQRNGIHWLGVILHPDDRFKNQAVGVVVKMSCFQDSCHFVDRSGVEHH